MAYARISYSAWRRFRRDAEMKYGDAYRTAFATLTLQIAEGVLPIFQR